MVEHAVAEQADNTPVIVVILTRAVSVEKPQAHYGITISLLKIHTLDLVDPLRDSVVVMLNDGMVKGDLFRQHLLRVVSVDLRGASEDQLESLASLQLEDVAGPDDVGLPKRLVVLFAVQPPELRREMVDEVVLSLENALELPERAYITPYVMRIRSVLEVTPPYFMLPPP